VALVPFKRISIVPRAGMLDVVEAQVPEPASQVRLAVVTK